MNAITSLNIIFAGTPAFSAVALDALIHSTHKIMAVYTQPDRPAGRGRKLTASPVKELALAHQLPVYQPVSLRDPQEQDVFARFNADVMVVVAYGMLLPKAILLAPRFGCINIHPSLLPRWRGAAPIQRAIASGDTKTGITIMQMDQGLDTGPLLYQVECPIDAHESSQQLHDRLAILGKEALLTVLNNLTGFTPLPQNNALATYAQKISKEEAELNWELPAAELAYKIRAFNPWPVAFTHCGAEVVRLWEASVIEQTVSEKPGKILRSDATGIDVATGKNSLRLLKLQFPNARALSVADILNSRMHDLAVGQVLGHPR